MSELKPRNYLELGFGKEYIEQAGRKILGFTNFCLIQSKRDSLKAKIFILFQSSKY